MSTRNNFLKHSEIEIVCISIYYKFLSFLEKKSKVIKAIMMIVTIINYNAYLSGDIRENISISPTEEGEAISHVLSQENPCDCSQKGTVH